MTVYLRPASAGNWVVALVQIERLGSPRPIRVDTRIIAATHRDLEQLIAAGTFREDLYYRLCVFPIRVPPLRERTDDIPLLVWRFVEEFATAFGKQIDSISKDDMAALQQYSWPGNIRELRSVVERAMIMGTERRLTFSVPAASTAWAGRSEKLEDVAREHIRTVLESTGWRVRGVDGAAKRLGLKPTTLDDRLSRLGLKRPAASSSHCVLTPAWVRTSRASGRATMDAVGIATASLECPQEEQVVGR